MIIDEPPHGESTRNTHATGGFVGAEDVVPQRDRDAVVRQRVTEVVVEVVLSQPHLPPVTGSTQVRLGVVVLVAEVAENPTSTERGAHSSAEPLP